MPTLKIGRPHGALLCLFYSLVIQTRDLRPIYDNRPLVLSAARLSPYLFPSSPSNSLRSTLPPLPADFCTRLTTTSRNVTTLCGLIDRDTSEPIRGNGYSGSFRHVSSFTIRIYSNSTPPSCD